MTVLMLLVLPSPVEPVGRGRLLAHPIPLPAAGVRLSGSRAQHVGVAMDRIMQCCCALWGLWLWRTHEDGREGSLSQVGDEDLKGLWMILNAKIARSNFRSTGLLSTQVLQLPTCPSKEVSAWRHWMWVISQLSRPQTHRFRIGTRWTRLSQSAWKLMDPDGIQYEMFKGESHWRYDECFPWQNDQNVG